MAAVKAAGADENTVTFFTSDNGAPTNHIADQTDGRGSNAPLRGFKGQVWEGGIRMPAMVRWPGTIRPGSRTDVLAATYDVFATMLSLAGARPPPERIIDGKDLTGVLLEHPGATGHRCLFQYYSGRLLAAVRCGR